MKKQTIAVIGAGFAGVTAAMQLEKMLYQRMKSKNDIEILLIDKNPYQTMLTGLHEVATERVSPDAVKIDLQSVFKKRHAVTLITDTVEKIDSRNYLILGSQAKYHYDYLIVAGGCRTAYFNVDGAKEHSLGLWSLEDALTLNRHIRDCFSRAAAETDPVIRTQLLSFYITGAGFTGCELAGDMAEWFPSLCKEFGIPPDEPTITVVNMLAHAASILPEKCSLKVENRFRKMGIQLQLSSTVTAVSDHDISVKKDGILRQYPTSTVIWAAGIEGGDLLDQIAGASVTRNRRLYTDSRLRLDGAYAAFAAGDNIFYCSGTVPAPQTVENAEQSGVVSARNVVAMLNGRTDRFRSYAPNFHGCMVTVGARWCISNISILGNGRMSFSPPSFFSEIAKHGVNLIYLFKVAGLRRALTYLSHEFVRSPKGRCFLSPFSPIKKMRS